MIDGPSPSPESGVADFYRPVVCDPVHNDGMAHMLCVPPRNVAPDFSNLRVYQKQRWTVIRPAKPIEIAAKDFNIPVCAPGFDLESTVNPKFWCVIRTSQAKSDHLAFRSDNLVVH